MSLELKHHRHALHQTIAITAVVKRQPRVGGDVAVAGGVNHNPPQHRPRPALVSTVTPPILPPSMIGSPATR